MLHRSTAIEIYDTPPEYPVPHRKPWGRLASLGALLLTLAAVVYIVAGILVQRA